jgi:hypothetical protein
MKFIKDRSLYKGEILVKKRGKKESSKHLVGPGIITAKEDLRRLQQLL